MAFIDPVLNPLLNLGPFWAIFIVAIVVAMISILAYKFLTNQKEMKENREKQKEYRQKIKTLKNDPEEAMRLQKEMSKMAMGSMKHSFKPMLITIVPFWLIYLWMASHLAYEEIRPGEPYSVSAEFSEAVIGEKATLLVEEGTELVGDATKTVRIEEPLTWQLRSIEGEHFVTIAVDQEQQAKKVLITEELEYEPALTEYENSAIKSININYKKLHPLGEFSIFSWLPGWLGLYFLLTLVFSVALRKVFKVY
ncbi:DUF106 domain-containing protein [Candidatus Woesearchaeota archaeon]|nr:DUF106 domain-containing protein [Candidatus Woesearchaeota archaeon]